VKHLKILIFSTLMLSLLPLSNALAAEPTRTGFQNDNVKAVDAYFTNLYGVGLLVTGDTLFVKPSKYGNAADSTWYATIDANGNPMNGFVDAAGNVMTVTGEADSIKVAGHDALILDTGLLIQHDGTMPVWGHSPTGAAIEGIVEINGASYLDGLLTVAGAFTSPGIDDNADDIAITIDVTTEKVTFSADAEVTATLTYAVAHADTTHHGAVTDGSTMYYDTTLNALVFTGW